MVVEHRILFAVQSEVHLLELREESDHFQDTLVQLEMKRENEDFAIHFLLQSDYLPLAFEGWVVLVRDCCPHCCHTPD